MSELIDNPTRRVEALREIIERLHNGASEDEVRADLKAIVRHCDAAEVAEMEQQLIREGVSIDKIMGMCDLHAALVKEVLIDSAHPDVPSGHPVDIFMRENAALREVIQTLREALASGARLAAKQAFNDLMDIDKHYARKENLLFSCLERHGITGPSQVMWGKDDEVRALLDELGQAIANENHCPCAAKALGERTFAAIESMMEKEEKILLPMALAHLSEAEWGEIHEQSPRFGWCLIEPGGEYEPRRNADQSEAEPVAKRGQAGDVSLTVRATEVPPKTAPSSDAIMFETGALTPAQMAAIFKTVPFDLTFVDEDDRVRFFSEGPRRVFVRPKAVIGRKVQFCHPPASVSTVNQILDDFKAGRQDCADFWITRKGRFVQIRYFAVRDESGKYLGTLEFTQDLTRERALEGERRLLQYD
ncbi:MAG: DUF438 domain-containing protein [Planctomycetota bacterium]|nr:MAG: DUF438 domain-containing protein [Planctomycetota bacterium]